MQEYDIKFKKFDKKRTIESQLFDLINDFKSIGVKVIDNAKFQNGYGEGVCLILTQLLDKYLINQNFIFKKPKLNDSPKSIDEDFEEVILEDNKDDKRNTTSTLGGGTFGMNFYKNKNSIYGSNLNSNRNSGNSTGKKRWNSGMSSHTSLTSHTQDTNANSAYSTETENFKVNPYQCIIESNIDPVEWRNELERVDKLLENISEISEAPEFLLSQSDVSAGGVCNTQNTGNTGNIGNTQNIGNNLIDDTENDTVRRISRYSAYLDKQANSNCKEMIKIRALSKFVEYDLKKIAGIEKVISSTGDVSDKVSVIYVGIVVL